MNRKTVTALSVVLVLSLTATFSLGYIYGYQRAHHIASFPCLGCLGLNPVFESSGFIKAEFEIPQFVAAELGDRPVFLHYRTDICPACDEMEPTVEIIQEEYGERVAFFDINLDHATEEEVNSYDLFDIQSEGKGRTGVPMFSAIYRDSDGDVFYSTSYGVIPIADLEKDIDLSLLKHRAGGVGPGDAGAPAVELFVDTLCKNCSAAGERAVQMILEGSLVPLVYVTDAPGKPGELASAREGSLAENLTFVGHPWSVFDYGKEAVTGWNDDMAPVFQNMAQNHAPYLENSSLDVEMSVEASGIRINYSADVEEPGTLHLFIQEVVSRYLNYEGARIPMVVLDRFSIPLDQGESNGSVFWNGTADVRWGSVDGGNVAVSSLFVTEGGVGLTRMSRAGVGEGVALRAERNSVGTLINGSENVSIRLTNRSPGWLNGTLTTDVEGNFQVTAERYGFKLPPNATVTVVLGVNHTGDVQETGAATVYAVPEGAPLLGDVLTLELFSRVELNAPEIRDITLDPEAVESYVSPVVSCEIADDSGVSGAQVVWFVCTDLVCSPSETVNMTEENGTYRAAIPSIEPPYNLLHYRVVVTDIHGNVNSTVDFETHITVTEKEQEETPFPGAAAAGGVLLAAAGAYYLVRRRRV